jgi:hypothetical protein
MNVKGDTIPRLRADKNGLIQWIDRNGGFISVNIDEDEKYGGWKLTTGKNMRKNDVIAFLPNQLCLGSNPNDDIYSQNLQDNAKIIMNSVDRLQWRTRLAVALLSERVNEESYFRSYIENLPYEFRGFPIFFSANEFR